MRGKKKICLLLICAALVLSAGCLFGKKMPVITYNGSTEVELGKTTVNELLEAGFTDRYSYSSKSRIDSWSWENFYAMIGDVSYGTLYAGNKSSNEIDFEKGKVFRVVIDYNDPDYVTGEILINGVNYAGYTRDQVKEAMGGAEQDLETDEYLVFLDDDCKYSFHFEDGSETVSSISIDDGTDWKLVIE